MAITSIRPVRLLIADDHELLREGFHTMLARNNSVELVGEAENGKELIRLARELNPDVIITDVKMPVMDGIAATRILTQELPTVGIIAFTMFDEEELITEMLASGAQGYLLKSASKAEILDAIRSIRQGKTYYCAQTTQKMARIIAESQQGKKQVTSKPVFSGKELEIIRMICEEFSNKEIASKVGKSYRTIEGHRERIQDKMKVRNTAGIVVYAIREGLYKL